MSGRWVETPPRSGNWSCKLGEHASVAVFQETRATQSLEALRAWTFAVVLDPEDDHHPHKSKRAAQSAALRAVHTFAIALAESVSIAMSQEQDEG